MPKKLTIAVDEAVYEWLYRTVGPRRISRFIQDLVRPHLLPRALDAAYGGMAADVAPEAEAEEWADPLLADMTDEAR